MTVTELKSLVDKLVARLGRDTPSPADFELASAYVNACAEANARLQQCAQMVADGSGTQALRLAAEKPNLLDAAAALSFAKSAEWLELCRANGLPQATKLDRLAIRALNELYSTGSRPDQTKSLYRDYRAAMVARDDAKALEVVRAIVHLDPADKDAAAGLAQLERKQREASVLALRGALASGEDRATLDCLARCECLEVEACGELQSALAVRARVQADEARAEIATTVPMLPELKASENWQRCGELASRVLALSTLHGIPLSSSDQETVQFALRYFESCRAESLRKARFKETLGALAATVDRLQEQAAPAGRQKLEELEENALDLRKAYDKAKDFQLPIPEPLVARVAQLAEAIDSNISRMRKARRLRLVLSLGAAAAALLAVAVCGYVALRAWQFTGEIRDLMAKRSAVPLRSLVADVRGNHALSVRLPFLQSALFEADGWLGGIAKLEESSDAAVGAAKALADSGFQGKTPEQAAQVFAQAEESLSGELPQDVAALKRATLADAQRKLALWMAEQRDIRIDAVKKGLQEASEQIRTMESADDPEALRNALRPLSETLDPLVAYVETPVEAMRLPEGIAAEARGARDKVKASQVMLGTYDAAIKNLRDASTAQDFAAALESLGAVPMPKAPMVRAAHQQMARRLDLHLMLGELIIPSALEQWRKIKSPAELQPAPVPAEPRQDELKRVLDMASQEDINNIYKAKLEHCLGLPPFSAAEIYTRGKLEPRESVSPTGEQTTVWEGDVYNPSASPGEAKFQKQTYSYDYRLSTEYQSGAQSGYRLSGQDLADGSVAWRKMNPAGIVDQNYTRFVSSILPALDRAKGTLLAPPLVGAFAFQSLCEVLNIRPEAWGAYWAPALARDMEEFRKVAGTVRGGDWLAPGKRPVGARVGEWFKRLTDFSYATQSSLHRRLAAKALEAGGLTICGYVDVDGNSPQLSTSVPDTACVLWGYTAEGGRLKPLFARADGSQPWSALAKGEALTPLVAAKVDTLSAVESALKQEEVSPYAKPAYLADLPPLFLPPPTKVSATAEKSTAAPGEGAPLPPIR